MTKAVIYARVSSREQEKEGYSIPAQLKLLNDYAEKRSLKIAKEFTDNETAKKEGRTNFTEMLAYLKKNKDIRIILVEKTDRLSLLLFCGSNVCVSLFKFPLYSIFINPIKVFNRTDNRAYFFFFLNI